MSNESVQGQCYCGAIRYELIFPTDFCSHCHCEDCRRSHSSAFVSWTSVPQKQFRFLSGEAQLKKYESHPGVRWGFCGQCGTSFLYECDSAPDKIYVTVASLIGSLDREPDAHVSFEEQALWAVRNEALPRYLGKTEQRLNGMVQGQLDHVEIYVADLEKTVAFWGWFLEKLGYSLFRVWESGRSWKLGGTYLVFVQAEKKYLERTFHRKSVGLNHLAFQVGSKEQMSAIVAALQERRIELLYPHQNGASRDAIFFEDPDRIKVEVVFRV